MTPEELARAFIEMYEDAGLGGVSDEMTHAQWTATNKHWQTYEACKEMVG